MIFSKVEVLSQTQEQVRNEFKNYLFQIVGLRGKTPQHLTESLERRVQIFARQHVDSQFTCAYDYRDVTYIQQVLDKLRENDEWMDYNRRNGVTLTSSLTHYMEFLCYKQGKQSSAKQVTPISPDTYREGRTTYVHAVVYERDRKAREACISHYGCKCAVCGFDFEKTYGDIGRDFIEVHHIVPIHERGGEYTVDPIKDLRPLCSNCHSMIHRRNPVYSIEELKALIGK